MVPPAIFGWARAWRIDSPALFWFLSALVIVGELLPIPVPRRHGLARVTISSAFALAILLRFGAGPAIVVYVVSLVVADGLARVAPIKLLFNAGQYALSIVAAAGVLTLTHSRDARSDHLARRCRPCSRRRSPSSWSTTC